MEKKQKNIPKVSPISRKGPSKQWWCLDLGPTHEELWAMSPHGAVAMHAGDISWWSGAIHESSSVSIAVGGQLSYVLIEERCWSDSITILTDWQRWAVAWSKAGWGGSRTGGDTCSTTLLTNHMAIIRLYMAIFLWSDMGGTRPVNRTIQVLVQGWYGTGPIPYYSGP